MYFLEQNREESISCFFSERLDDNDWKRCKNYYGNDSKWEDLQSAIASMKRNYADLARCIHPMRIVNEEGYIFCVYDPERDMRLPGMRWCKIQRDAYYLWEKAGKPDGVCFWNQAESNLEYSDGVFEADGEYVWYRYVPTQEEIQRSREQSLKEKNMTDPVLTQEEFFLPSDEQTEEFFISLTERYN